MFHADTEGNTPGFKCMLAPAIVVLIQGVALMLYAVFLSGFIEVKQVNPKLIVILLEVC